MTLRLIKRLDMNPPKKRIFVYSKSETAMNKLKRGDIFRMDDSEDIYLVTKEAIPQEDKPEGYFQVEAHRLMADPHFLGVF